jgi:dienelactone hydrolase
MHQMRRPHKHGGVVFGRRALLRAACFAILALSAGYGAQAAQARKSAVVAGGPLNRFPRMMQEYCVSRVREARRPGLKAQNALRTRADAEAYVREVREKIGRCFGPWPERTPLRPRVTGVVERDAYRIEKVLFESRPGFLVSANLYVPKGRPFPRPGVVGACGHSSNAKARDVYQSFAQGLARLGYVTLIYDPIGQGERLQYGHLDAEIRPRVGVGEHLYAGNQQFLVGEFFGAWRAWDGIRALDYLLSRKEVDPKRVGITGCSGGGTMTTWLCGVEPRWSMAAPSCFVTTFLRNLENELPADTEQCPPRALALSLDHSDFLAAMAPKPIVVLAEEHDFFDVRGTEEALRRLRRLYALLEAPESVRLYVGPGPHGYDRRAREAMYDWFNRAAGVSGSSPEDDIVVEKDETLWCAPKGQVAELGSRTVFSFTRATSKALARERVPLDGEDLKAAVADALRLPERQGVPAYRILRPTWDRKYPKRHATTYAVETEPGIHALVYRLGEERLLGRPPRGIPRAVLYVAHHSSDDELRGEPLIADVLEAEPKAAFYTCDVRGIGESRPNTCGTNMFLNPYGSDYFYAIHGIMLDYPYVGQKTHDVLRVVDWLRSLGHEDVHLVAKGWGALPATFAALLSPAVTQVTLKNALTSYADIAESETYAWPLSSLLPGVLRQFDLPDCYRALESKTLRRIDPWGADATTKENRP